MRGNDEGSGGIRRGSVCVTRRVGMTALVVAVAGCSSIPPRGLPASGPGVPTGPAQATAAGGGFVTSNSMLDTWNAVGQLLVRTDGVTYEGRSQMLGIYSVRYRGERFLILTRARVLSGAGQTMQTSVTATLLDGKASGSAAAIELLIALQQRLPAELAHIAAGGRRAARCGLDD